MKRRNFLKGIFGAYALASGYFSFKYVNGKKTAKTGFEIYDKGVKEENNNKKRLTVVEIPICYHCNLNCAYCDHFAPIAQNYEVPVEKFKKDLTQLKKVTNGAIGTIWLLGGEPLLHRQISELIKIAKSVFPKTNIALTTNGLLLDKQPDIFWQTCFENKVTIMVENYVLNEKNANFSKIYEKLKDYNCNLHVNTPKYSFRQTRLSKEKLHNPTKRYQNCKCHQWHMFDDGKFYSCPTINGVEKFFNNKFPNLALEVKKEDTLDIYKISSIDKIIDFYNKPKSICAHCDYHKVKQWQLSKKEAKEWYKV